MDYMSIIEDLAGEYGVFMNIALYVIEDMQKSTDDLKREFKTAKLPHMRFYPNEKTGDLPSTLHTWSLTWNEIHWSEYLEWGSGTPPARKPEGGV